MTTKPLETQLPPSSETLDAPSGEAAEIAAARPRAARWIWLVAGGLIVLQAPLLYAAAGRIQGLQAGINQQQRTLYAELQKLDGERATLELEQQRAAVIAAAQADPEVHLRVDRAHGKAAMVVQRMIIREFPVAVGEAVGIETGMVGSLSLPPAPGASPITLRMGKGMLPRPAPATPWEDAISWPDAQPGPADVEHALQLKDGTVLYSRAPGSPVVEGQARPGTVEISSRDLSAILMLLVEGSMIYLY